MRIKSLLFLIFNLLFVTSLLVGCGGGDGPGSPGSRGTEDTGVTVDVRIITPTYFDDNTSSVDAFRVDCDPDSEVTDPEPFADHSATVEFTARLLNPNTNIQPGILYIEKYTVEYRRSNDSIGAPPIESDTRFMTIQITPPQGAEVNEVTVAGLILVDLKRKDQYAEDIFSGRYSAGPAGLNNYTAIYTFSGKNEYGEKFSFKGQTDFQIGNFCNCGS